MTPEAILAQAPRVLTQEQRERYFATGFLAAEDLIPDEWLKLLRARSREFIDKSRAVAASNQEFDIGPQHRPDRPHVRRLRALIDRHLDPTPCPVPPDWSKEGYGSIFTAQNAEL
jgi:ectoine hydroxylase